MKKLLAILACLLILCSFAACAAGSKAAPGNELYADQAAAEDGISYGSIKGGGMSEKASQVTSADGAIEEKIVKTVNLTVETKEYEQYISAIRSDVAAAGGYVETSTTATRAETPAMRASFSEFPPISSTNSCKRPARTARSHSRRRISST